MLYVLDTNTLIYHFKGMGQVTSRLENKSPEEIAIPTIVLFEIQVGIEKSASAERRTRQLRQLVDRVIILPFERAEAQAAALIRADLEQRGMPIGPIDTLIAGVASANSATLVTHNTREFSRVRG